MFRVILKIFLLLLAIILAFFIYRSVNGLVKFEEQRIDRYADAAEKLIDIADAQRLYRGYYGHYTDNLDSLKNYINNGQILMINRKDSSGYVYDEARRIDVMRNFTIIDTLVSPISVKDSIFGNRSMENFGFVPVEDKLIPIEMYTTFVDRVVGQDSTNIQRDHLFKASVSKRAVLEGLDEDYIQNEMYDETSPIKADEIQVGSDRRPTLEGNWSPVVDARIRDRRSGLR